MTYKIAKRNMEKFLKMGFGIYEAFDIIDNDISQEVFDRLDREIPEGVYPVHAFPESITSLIEH